MDFLTGLNGKRILLVEDNLQVVEQLAAILRRGGYTVETAYTVGDAVAAQPDRFVAALVNPAMKDREGRAVMTLLQGVPGFAALPVMTMNDLPGFENSTVLLMRVGQLANRRRDSNPPSSATPSASAPPSGPSLLHSTQLVSPPVQPTAPSQQPAPPATLPATQPHQSPPPQPPTPQPPTQPPNPTLNLPGTATANGAANPSASTPSTAQGNIPTAPLYPTPSNGAPTTAPPRTPKAQDLRETQEIGVETDDTPTLRSSNVRDMYLEQRLAAYKTLASLGRTVSSTLDLNQTLNQIVEAATALTGAEEGLLLLPDEEDKALYLRARKGIDEDSARNFRIKHEEPLVGNVYRTGVPVNQGNRGPLRLKTEFFVQSLVYVPLRYQNRIIGVLGVNNRVSGRVFTSFDQELLEHLSAQAAIAIENARLYEERLTQNKRLSTLYEVGQSVNSTLALPDVLMNIARQILKVFGVNACLIKQTDPSAADRRAQNPTVQTALLTENELSALAHVWQASWREDTGPRLVLESRPQLRDALNSNTGYIVQRSQPALRTDAEHKLLEEAGAEYMLVLPVRTGNQNSFGMLDLYYRTSEKAEIHSDIRARVRSLAVEIYAMVKPKREGPPPADVYEKARQILELTKAQWLVYYVVTGENQLTRILQYGAAVFLEAPHPQELMMPPHMQPVFTSAKPVSFHMRQPNLPEPVRELMAGFGAEALLCLPLVIKGKVFGTFIIYNTLNARTFAADELELAQALMAQAATAIEHARLYRDLQQSLTDLKQAQINLVQSERLSTMGKLAAVVAHQINNPLTTVMVDSEIILQDMTPDNPLREPVQAIRRSGQRAHAVVKRLLSTARRSPDDKPLWVDVHDTIQGTLDLVSSQLERNRIKFEVDLDRSLPSYLQAKPGHLEDVWLNLLLNAQHALANTPNASLGILSRRAALFLNVMVWDNGPGIPLEIQQRIFEPFFTTKPAGEGTGLGLYICRQVVEECGGKLTVDSAPGQGTLFRISLPVSETRM